MADWDFGKTTRKCAGCNNPLPEESPFFSALFLDETNQPVAGSKTEYFVRRDYCQACWTERQQPNPVRGKSGGAFSYWKMKISRKEKPKTPREVLVEFFDNLINPVQDKPLTIDESIRTKVIYLFSLVLLRKRILKIKENISKDNQPFLVFERVGDSKTYEVPELAISEDELVGLREQFAKLFEFSL